MPHTITVIRGDGIGPEIMDATLHVLDAMGLDLAYEEADAGMAALDKHGELLPQASMDSIRKNKVALKRPLNTTVGGGFASINVELRKIGRASCRERVCQYEEISVVAVTLTKENKKKNNVQTK